MVVGRLLSIGDSSDDTYYEAGHGPCNINSSDWRIHDILDVVKKFMTEQSKEVRLVSMELDVGFLLEQGGSPSKHCYQPLFLCK